MKRILTLLLVVTMVMTAIPFSSVAAAEIAEAAVSSFEEITLENVSVSFVEDSWIIEQNPDAVGGMQIDADITGPSNVAAMYISSFAISPEWELSYEEIYAEALETAEMWKKENVPVNNTVPFFMSDIFPVYIEDFSMPAEVLLVATDRNYNPVGYSIVEIPFVGIEGWNPGDFGGCIDSGYCGDNLTYKLIGTGELIIEGFGDMWDYEGWNDYGFLETTAPWYNNRDLVTMLTVGSDVTYIGEWAFAGCNMLMDANICGELSGVGDYAFYECETLGFVNFPQTGCGYIGDYVFAGCTGLTDIMLSDDLQTIGEYAFAESGLCNIYIPAGISLIPCTAFSGCDSLTEIYVEWGTYPSYFSLDGVLFSGGMLVQYPIGNPAMGYIVPDNYEEIIYIDTIGECAFRGSKLTDITLPENLRTIGSFAFSDSTNLEQLTIPESVSAMGENVFLNCPNLTLGVYRESYGEEYAKNYDIPYVYIDGSLPEDETVRGIVLDLDSQEIEVGDSFFLNATVIPAGAANSDIYWTCNNDSVSIESSEGGACKVTGLSEGKATVTVTTNDGRFSASCNVTVKNKQIELVELRLSNLNVEYVPGHDIIKDNKGAIGGVEIDATVLAPATAKQTLIWSSGKDIKKTFTYEKICEEALKATEIWKKAGIPARNSVPYDIGLTCPVFPDECGGSFDALLIGYDSDYTPTGYAFVSCNIPEYEEEPVVIPVNDVEIDPEEFELYVDEFFRIDAIVYPEDATNQEVYWKSSDESVATVETDDSGTNVVTAVSAGTAVITVTTVDGGYKAYCYVTVNNYPEPDDGISEIVLNHEYLTLEVGESFNLDAYALPDKTHYTDVYWQSSDGDVATVEATDSGSGCVTAVSKGEATIIATSNNGEYSSMCYVTVVADEQPDGDITASGECGEDLTWTLYDAGELVISGTGAMTDWYAGTMPAWYDYRESITVITIQEGVTTVGRSAFTGLPVLERVVLPVGLVKICDGAFYGCVSLNEIEIPSTVTTVGNMSFWGCISLERIEFPYGVTVIEEGMFVGCESLTEVIIPDSVITIEKAAFASCSALLTITIPQSVLSISPEAFRNITIIINSYTGSYAEIYAKENNFSFVALDIIASGKCGEDVTWTLYDDGELVISGTGAMYDYSNDTYVPWRSYSPYIFTVTIESGVTNIGNYAFYYCYNLVDIVIPESVLVIGDYAFYECNSLGSVNLPTKLTGIGAYAFYYCYSIKEIFLPETVTIIGNYAFYSCTGLTTIVIPAGVTEIHEGTFYCCYNLKSITIPATVTAIYSKVFFGCTNIIITGATGSYAEIYAKENNLSFVVARKIVATGDCGDSLVWTLYDDGELVISGTGAMTNGTDKTTSPFYNYFSSIKRVVFESGVTSIGRYAFSYCKTLVEVIIPETVIEIGYNSFIGCTSLKEVVLPDSLVSLGYNSFSDCSSLEYVHIGKNLEIFGNNALYNCIKLKTITVDSENKNFCSDDQGALYNKKKTQLIQYPSGSALVKYILPATVTTISTYALYECRNLSFINVEAGNTAFVSIDGVLYSADKKILVQFPIARSESIIIPEGVTTLGAYSFYNAGNIIRIILPESLKVVGEYAFASCIGLVEIIIPDGVTALDEGAFYGCTNLMRIHIPESVTIIDSKTFYGQNGLVIYSKSGSYAQTYASSNGITFKAVVPVTGIVLDMQKVTFNEIGAEETLIAIISPNTATNDIVTWKSSDPGVVSISVSADITTVCYIRAVSEGTATITATTRDGKKVASCEVSVVTQTNVPVTGVGFTTVILNPELEIGKRVKLTAVVYPEDATNKNVTWSSTNEDVLTVVDGVVTAIAPGFAEVVVTTEDGKYTASVGYTVLNPRVALNFDANGGTVSIENTYVRYSEAYGELPTPEVRVGYSFVGWFTELSGGELVTEDTIVNTTEEHTLYARWKSQIPAANLKQELTVGEKVSVSWSFDPGIVVDLLKLSSTDESVVKIYKVAEMVDGSLTRSIVVEAMGVGEATVTLSYGEHVLSFDITVLPVLVTDIAFADNNINTTMEIGDTATLTVVVYPENATNKKVFWSSTDESVVTVADGLVTAVGAGVAEIVVETEDGGYTENMLFTVLNPKVTVYFDSNGGATDTTSTTARNGEPYGILPTPVKSGYSFAGWYTAISGGELVTAETVVTESEDHTLYAHWDIQMPDANIKKELKVGEKVTVNWTTHPGETVINMLRLTSSDESVVKVYKTTVDVDGTGKLETNIIVEAVGVGNATISIRFGTYAAELDVTVIPNIVNVNGITLDKTEISLEPGDTEVLAVTVTPSDATNKNVIWHSTNDDVATVVDGVVTAVGAGVAEIVVETEDGGYTATCTVTVNSKDESNLPVFTVGCTEGKPGETVTVELGISNNIGITSMNLLLSYDETLSLVSMEQSGEALSGLRFTKPGNMTSGNPVRILFDGVEADYDEGIFLTLMFEIPETAEDGEYEVSISYEFEDGIFTDELVATEAVMVPGKVTVVSYMLGDVNEDGRINSLDVTYLRRHLAGGYNVTINERAADVNCDGRINSLDVTYLRRYLAGGYGIELK